MENIIDVTNYILSKNKFTPKQVQKLLYYAYSTYLVKYNEICKENMEKLFDGQFKANGHGPVNQEVYDYLKTNPVVIEYSLADKTKNFLDKIILIYGSFTGYELELMTRKEIPWIRAYNLYPNMIIKDEDIFEYYKKYKIGRD